MNKELLLFQLGPVQEFIAQAETVGDLWAGSYLLSMLVWAGLNQVPEKEENVVFPDLSSDVVRTALEDNMIPTIPNRFLAWCNAGEGEKVAADVKMAIKGKLDEYISSLKFDEHKQKAAQTQANQFLQMTCAILPNPTGKMGEDYKAIGRKLAMRRNVREFEPWREDAPTGIKDFLSGKETAISNGRGAMNLVKEKLACDNDKRDFDVEGNYIAVIAMDGDKMGETLSSFEDENEHRAFSSKLAEYACEVSPIIEKYNGALIYDGGDDVLAVVPAKKAIDCAKELRNMLTEKVKGKDEKTLTASAGIAVGHKSVPLQDLVHKAHAAESRAKNSYNRDALAVSVFKRSGEILEWGCKWGSKAFDIYKELSESLKDSLSRRFPYKLAELLQPYGDISGDMKEIVQVEFEHAWERSTQKAMSASFADAVSQYLNDVFDESGKPTDFLDLFLCETFINRPREGEDND
jgi:CRISPR-associated protein Cmr2